MNKLAQKGTIECLMILVDFLGSKSLKEKNNNGETALDIIEKRRDNQTIKPLTEKIMLNDSLEIRKEQKSNFKKRI